MPIIFIRDNGIITESKSNYNDNNIDELVSKFFEDRKAI